VPVVALATDVGALPVTGAHDPVRPLSLARRAATPVRPSRAAPYKKIKAGGKP
jgi:hypothetical protein